MKAGRFKPQTRVGVVGRIDPDGAVKFLGYGIYEGDFIPPPEHKIEYEAPRIKLDSGTEVWGFQFDFCGTEEAIKDFFKDRNVIPVTLEDLQKAPRDPEATLERQLDAASIGGSEFGIDFAREAMEIANNLIKTTRRGELGSAFVLNAALTGMVMVVGELSAVRDQAGLELIREEISFAIGPILERRLQAAVTTRDVKTPAIVTEGGGYEGT